MAGKLTWTTDGRRGETPIEVPTTIDGEYVSFMFPNQREAFLLNLADLQAGIAALTGNAAASIAIRGARPLPTEAIRSA